MILIEYGLFDRVTGEYIITFKAKNDKEMERQVKSAMLSKQPNLLNTDTDDKDIYQLADFDTSTGCVRGFEKPLFVNRLEQLRQDILNELRKKKLEVQEAGGEVNE